MRRGTSTCRTISSIVNVRNVRCALLEARFVSALSKVIPIVSQRGMTLDETFLAIARAFPRADRRALSSFSATVPKHLAESVSVTVRAVCARVSRGEQLKHALCDASRLVREAAVSRLVEVGEVLPDVAPSPVDLSDEYYASIAQRLVNDFPDRNGDWVRDAVAATVRSYRTTSGVQLDAEKLLDAVDERLADLNEEGPCGGPLDEAIEQLAVASCHDPQERAVLHSQPHITIGTLPRAVSKHIFEEAGAIVVDGPRRVLFDSSIGSRERTIIKQIVESAVRDMHGKVTVQWTQDGPRSVSLRYGAL